MNLLNLWQEARGNVLRRRYEGLKPRIDAADASAKSACFGVVKSNFELLASRYASASLAQNESTFGSSFQRQCTSYRMRVIGRVRWG